MNSNKPYLFTFYLLLFVTLFSGTMLIDGCSNNKKDDDGPYTLTGDVVRDGQHLVQVNCTPCHKLVPPNALTKDVWTKHTFPAMAKYMGISVYGGTQYFQDKPDSAKLSMGEWQAMIDYYKKVAPDSLPAAAKPSPLVNDWAGFSLKTPAPGKDDAFTTMVAYNANDKKIYAANGLSNVLAEWNSSFKTNTVALMPSPAVNAIFTKDAAGANQAIVNCIGRLEPIDFPNGKVITVNLDKPNDTTNEKLIGDILLRPVYTIQGDFNKDGLTDLITLSEGHLKGRITLFTQTKGGKYEQKELVKRTGAVQAVTGDFNGDGWLDFMVLYGSVDEGLVMYTNDHKGGFTEKTLLRFPPVYGCTSFQLADMDHDGKPDLILTCGYNYRISRILKPYHGLYIFKNTGNWNFKQQWFYPINGCTKAIAADFDGDGDLDIATSAFFADLKNNPAEGMIYFEQDKPFSFKAHAIPVSKYGRWASMDVADYNGDGKPDIILGNYSHGFAFQDGFTPNWNTKLPFIVLENNNKK